MFAPLLAVLVAVSAAPTTSPPPVSPPPSSAPSAEPSSAPTAAPVPSAAATPQVTPAPAPSTSPLPQPTPQATPLYKVVYRPTPDPNAAPDPVPNPPLIDEIDLNDSVFAPPCDIHLRVLTTANVVTLTVATFGRSTEIPEQKPGVFVFDGYLPDVPSFLRNRIYDVLFTAGGIDGRTATATIQVSLK